MRTSRIRPQHNRGPTKKRKSFREGITSTNPEEIGEGEIGGEVREYLVHVLGRIAPGGPEMEDRRSSGLDDGVELLLRPDFLHRTSH